RPACPIAEAFQAAFLIAFEDLVASLPGNAELAAQGSHAFPVLKPDHKAHSFVHYRSFLPWHPHFRPPDGEKSVTHVSGTFCYPCLGTVITYRHPKILHTVEYHYDAFCVGIPLPASTASSSCRAAAARSSIDVLVYRSIDTPRPWPRWSAVTFGSSFRRCPILALVARITWKSTHSRPNGLSFGRMWSYSRVSLQSGLSFSPANR